MMWTQEIKKLDENMFASDLEGWNREARGDLNEQPRSGGFNCWCCRGSWRALSLAALFERMQMAECEVC